MKRSPVVLLHGMWCTPKVWDYFARRLESMGYEVWAPSLHEECGLDVLGRLSIRGYTERLTKWLRERNFSAPPIVIGHSLGALVAQQLAQSHRFAALVLLAPVPPRGINLIYPEGLRTTFNILSSPKFWAKPTALSWDAARYGLLNELPEDQAKRVYAGLVPGSGRVYKEVGFWFLGRDRVTAVDVKKIKEPILIVGGVLDRILPISVVRKTAKLYKNADYIECVDSAHWLIEEPVTEALTEEIDTWLMSKIPGLKIEQSSEVAAISA